MARIATILSWISGALALFCASGYLLTFFGQNLVATFTGLAPCLLFFLFAPLIWYSIRLGENNVMNYIIGWQRWIVAGLFLFVVLNFTFNFQRLNEGSPEIEGDRYIVSNRGTFVREVTESEYHELQLARIRLFSGQSILFFAIATFGWQGVNRRLRASPQ